MNAERIQATPQRGPDLRRILVPTDFSRPAERALGQAVSLARQAGGVIILLHVVEWPFGSSELDALKARATPVAGSAPERLETLARERVPPALLERTVVRIGRPHAEIVRAARGLKCGLIVMATQGRTGLRRALLGNTAERVVRHAGCPVLTVRCAAPEAAPRRHRILVPVDFSARSPGAVRFAAELARTMGGCLALLHVAEPMPEAIFTGYPDELAMYAREAAREAREKLAALAAGAPDGIRVETLLREGAPRAEIPRAAREWRSDLIVLPTRGLTGVKYIVLGSVAEAVVRHAPCPVLTLSRS